MIRERTGFHVLIGVGLLLTALSLTMVTLPRLAQAQTPAGCPDGMTHYWRLDEASAGAYADSYGTSDGACAAGKSCPVPTADGKISGAQIFTGGSSATGIDIPDDDSFEWGVDDSFTVEFWMYRPGSISGNEVIVGRQGPTHPNPHIWIGVKSSGVANFSLYANSGDNVSVAGTTDLTQGGWHHFVAVRDAEADQLRLYVDGKEENSVGHTYSSGFETTTELNLGWLDLSGGFHYQGQLDEVATYNRVLSETEIKTRYYLSRGYCETCATPVRIMPLGDSITVGNASGVIPDDEAHWVSYRKDLWESLEAAGYDVDFVGGESHGYAFDPPFDSEHEGHGGWTDSQIRDNVVGFLAANPADVVLLHIGTNGLDPDAAQVAQILDNIDTVSEDITIILARIINRQCCTDSSPCSDCATTTSFNDNVEAMADARIANGDKIIIVDMETGAGIDYRGYPTGDMNDNLHPYATGYAKMAAVWLDALDDFLPVCAPPSGIAPTITSDPITQATVGVPYSYDVDATGDPAPTYSLTTYPAGMTIEPNTGLVEWTPAAGGAANVTVQATNTAGTDEQSFTIYVGEVTACPAEMISYWKLEESSGPTYTDYYDDNNGVCAVSCPSQTPSQVGYGQGFNGSSTGIDVPADASFDWSAGDSFSIEFWMKKDGPAHQVLVGRDDGGAGGTGTHWWAGSWGDGGAAFILIATDGSGSGSANYLHGSTNLGNNAWHHIVAVRDASSGYNRIYVDGTLEDERAVAYTAGFDATTALNIGYMAYHGTPGYFYGGVLDEVALYNKALSSTEIEQHYVNGMAELPYCEPAGVPPTITSTPVTDALVGVPYSYDVDATGDPDPTYSLTESPVGMTVDENTGLISWTPAAGGAVDVTVQATNTAGMDEQSFTIYVAEVPSCPVEMISHYQLDESAAPYEDSMGGPDATCTNCPIAATGAVGGAQQFDGTDDEVNVPDNDQFEWGAANEFSIEYWMKTDASSTCSGNEVIVGRQGPTHPNPHWWIGCANGGDQALFVLLDTSGGNGGNGNWPSAGIDITDGAWHHIAAVKDATHIHIYVDGTQHDSVAKSYSAGFDSTTDLNIGYLNLSGHYRYEGLLDEVAVYDRALSPTEIEQHYANGMAELPYCGPAEVPPTITSTPVLDAFVGVPYSYDVEATGDPAPTYSLPTYPAGMTIDPNTGLIEWTPAGGGGVDVTVQATNAAGTDEQSFTIYVGEVTACPAEMISYWKLDEGSAPYGDLLGGPDATCTNCPVAATGAVGGAQQFDGTDDEVNVADSDQFEWGAADEFSIEYWMKSSSDCGGNEVILGRDDGSSSLHWWTGCADSGDQALFVLLDKNGGNGGNGDWPYSGTDITDGGWHHLAFVKDATHIRVYVDGTEKDSVAKSYSAGFDGVVPLNIGYLNLGGHYRYEGLLDEVSVYDRGLSPTEIEQHYVNGMAGLPYCEPLEVPPTITSTPVTQANVGCLYLYDVEATGYPAPTYSLTVNPAGMTIDENSGVISWTPTQEQAASNDVTVEASNSEDTDTQSFAIEVGTCPCDMISYWKLDETNSPTTFHDFYDGNDGTCAGGCPTPGTGVVDGALSFDGGDGIEVADDPSLHWSDTDSLTVEAWLRTTQDCTGNKVFIGKHKNTGEAYWWLGCTGTGGTVEFELADSDGVGGHFSSGTGINDDGWHHIAAVISRPNTVKIYVDGDLKKSESLASPFTGDLTSTRALNVGYYITGYRYVGLLDEVAVYRRALSEPEIQEHHSAGLAGRGYCEAPSETGSITIQKQTDPAGGAGFEFSGDLGSFSLDDDGSESFAEQVVGDYEVTEDPPVGWTLGGVECTGGDSDPIEDGVTVHLDPDEDIVCTFTNQEISAPACPVEMLSYYQLDESAAPYADLLGGPDATCTDCPVSATGIVGGAQQFSSNQVLVPDDDTFDWAAGDSFSIEFWMKRNTAAHQVVIGRDDPSTDLHWWVGTWVEGTAAFVLRDTDGAGGAYLYGTTNLGDDLWHHVVAVRDAGASENRIYVDGSLEDSEAATHSYGFGSSVPIELGTLLGGYYYTGALDEVALYDRVLSASEIELHYDLGRAGLPYCERSPVGPTITSEPVTQAFVGVLYSYDVDSTGYPVPTYTLTVNPPGMTIGEETGLIQWTPSATGPYDVTVEAHNSEGTDDQSFIIEVGEAPVCPAEMISYWKLDETSGTTFDDYYDENDGGCSTGHCPDFAAGLVDGALDFNGTSDYLTVADDPSLDWASDDSFTIELWAQLTNCSSRNKVMIGRDDRPKPGVHWWLGCGINTETAVFNLIGTDDLGVAVTGDTPINDGEWHHIVAVRDESANENRLYVDGQLDATPQSFDYLAGFEAPTTLGIGYMAYEGTPDYYYDGSLDEIALYHRALSATEIEQHYNFGRAGLPYCERPPMAPTITSDPVTQAFVGVPYSYDVEATGFPAPTFALTENPGGMTIDDIAGLISWMPAAVGDFDVTVEASNSEGSDAQEFTISVVEPGPCPPDIAAYWRLDETTSGTYDDSINVGNDGECATGMPDRTCPSPTVGAINSAQQFARASQSGIDVAVPTTPGQDAPFDWGQSDSFSIEFWVKGVPGVTCAGSGTSNNEVIVGRDDEHILHWWFGCANTTGNAHFQLGSRNNASGDYLVLEGSPINDGAWHHLVGVRDGALGINRLYVDGVQADWAEHMYTAGFDSDSAALNLGWLNLSPGYHFTGELDEVALYDRVLSEYEIRMHYYLGRGYCDACISPVLVMPLGDSITVGNASGADPDDEAHWVSYRKDLWETLDAGGYYVDFIGYQSHGYAFDPPFDSDHAGYGGITDDQIAHLLDTGYNQKTSHQDTPGPYLETYPADVILLHIGTNGLATSSDDVEDILAEVDEYSEKVTVILARIINRQCCTDSPPCSQCDTTTTFNDNVQAMAEGRIADGDKIILVDMEDGAGIDYRGYPTGDMNDNLHPYATGYTKMSGVWEEALASFLPVCGPAPTCYALSLGHTGQGSDPMASLTHSAGCPLGEYVAGEYIELSGAVPDTGWQISSWTGTDDNSSTASTNSLTMPDSAHSAGVNYTEIPPTCYALTLGHTGQGSDPVASPTHSTGCPEGEYLGGEYIELSGAVPDVGWRIGSWSGTGDDSSTADTNWLIMPASAHPAAVNYTVIPAAAIEVLKSAEPALIFSGDAVTYTYRITNIGDAILSDITLTDDRLGDISLGPSRVPDDLVALYTFEEGTGSVVHDVSGIGTPLDLTVADPDHVSWLPGGGLSVDSATIVESAGAASKIIDACQSSNEVTIEVWVKPDNATQGGPARIVTLSDGALLRNFTLGQSGAAYDTRLRTTATSDNGIPSLTAGTVSTDLTHVVYTRSTAGVGRQYVNGVQVGALSGLTGTFSNWDASFHFGLANEFGAERSWLGEYHLVAIYSRALSQLDVTQNYEAGSGVMTLLPDESIEVSVSTVLTEDTTNTATAAGTPPIGDPVTDTDTATVIVVPVGQIPNSITIAKQTQPGGGTGFEFAGDLGGFSLDDADTDLYGDLEAGDYEVTEVVPDGWLLTEVICTGGDSDSIADGVVIHLDPGEAITCLFTNEMAHIYCLPLACRE